jgi:hypothetical protein
VKRGEPRTGIAGRFPIDLIGEHGREERPLSASRGLDFVDAASAFFGKMTVSVFPGVDISLSIFLEAEFTKKLLLGKVQELGDAVNLFPGKINSPFALAAGSALGAFKKVDGFLKDSRIGFW